MGSRRMVERLPYPVDERGFGLPIEELGFEVLDRDLTYDFETNEHHRNYCARLFGRFVISNTFRNLEPFIHRMAIQPHQRLHEQYLPGIKELPPLGNMLDRIEQADAEGTKLMVRGLGGYALHSISNELMASLYDEYNQEGG